MLKLCINHKNVKNQTILPVTSFETLSVEWSISRSMESSAPSVTWDGARASAVADEPKRTVIRTLGGGEGRGGRKQETHYHYEKKVEDVLAEIFNDYYNMISYE